MTLSARLNRIPKPIPSIPIELTGKISTNGKGLWSDVRKKVTITKAKLRIYSTDFGEELVDPVAELQVFFDESWNIDTDGLIYTDPAFLRDLKSLLKSKGYSHIGIGYSEQGMQGENYVSLDADEIFVKQFGIKYKHEYE